MSNFAFLKSEWPQVFEASARAESALVDDPRTSCFYARRALELMVQWAFKADSQLRLPYQDNLSALLHEPTFKQHAGERIFAKAKFITQLGNRAVHGSKAITQSQSLSAVAELFHVAYWLSHTYARGARPEPGVKFDAKLVPSDQRAAKQTADQLRDVEAKLHERDEDLATALADKNALSAEITRLRAEVAAAKASNASQPDTHDYDEAATRDKFIDLLLLEAGWTLENGAGKDIEYEVDGMPLAYSKQGIGFVDYVLWGDDGKPLGIVEAKRTKRSPKEGQEQARLYANALEARFGQRPVIFCSNGYEHWIWDDQFYAPRRVQGFYTKGELELAIQRRTTRKSLIGAPIDKAIAGRYYQERAIRKVGEAFETDNERKALLVMATGSGKTRTAVALVKQLMEQGWAKRVLFLADRTALVKQATNAFKAHYPDVSPVNLVTDKSATGRAYVSTYPTMMNLIEQMDGDARRFGAGYFDLIIVDEAHRSVYQKYRAIFDYFDSLLLGLTATPKDEIDTNTYRVFDLEDGVPTDAYDLDDAVKDGFLVPAEAVSVPLRLPRDGARYDDLSEEEREQWDALEWDDDGVIPDEVAGGEFNSRIFNEDTVDKVIAHFMERGQKVASGDLIGKTIIFAANQKHAEFIEERLNANYPKFKGLIGRTIHHGVSYAESLIDDFSAPDKLPQIAISVDMLDTGIDVPEVVNLVFFKQVRSRTKFWQMVGRGTRLREDLFGPGLDKKYFYIFDYCGNVEYFNQNLPTTDGSLGATLSKRLFETRANLVLALDQAHADPQLRSDVAETLRGEVTSMPTENFVVRPKRREVEKFSQKETWEQLTSEDVAEAIATIAGLPTDQPRGDVDAKRFDLVVLKLQLFALTQDPAFSKMKTRVQLIAQLLREKDSIPAVKKELELLDDLLADEWWNDVTVGLLENMRKRIRDLVRLIELKQRKPVYSDFEDEMGEEVTTGLTGAVATDGFERFRDKARAFLRSNEDHVAVRKVRMNKQLTQTDLNELERILQEAGISDNGHIDQAKNLGLGLFVRSLVGLDREAAKQALASFLDDSTLTANQIEFVNLIVEHLTELGVMDAKLLYESPFTDFAPEGPDELFGEQRADELFGVLARIREVVA